MTREEWIALAERCEAATGPDREIDVEIFRLLNPKYAGPEWQPYAGGLRHIYDSSDTRCVPPPEATPYRCTASLDAITALIEREFPRADRVVSVVNGNKRAPRVGVTLFRFNGTGSQASGGAGDEARAHCAAFCRAEAEVA